MGDKVLDWYRYTGAVHMHTTQSDGTKSLEELATIAAEAGLDFILVTDHMTLADRIAGKERFYGKTAVIIGYEHNDPNDKHHYLIFDSPRVYESHLSPKEYVAAAVADSAIGIIAHPDEVRSRMKQYPPYPWLDWSVEGYNGIELWNQMSEWMERLTPTNRLWMALSPRKSMIAPTDRVLAKWDEVNLKRPCAGIASVDAHAFPVKLGPLRLAIFPYKVHFKCIRTDILLREPLSYNYAVAKRQILNAIVECRLVCSNVRWGGIEGFAFYAEHGDRKVSSGESLGQIENSRLRASLPTRANIKIIRDGATVVERVGTSIELPVREPGMYRLEAWRGRRGWIFTNHIRVGR